MPPSFSEYFEWILSDAAENQIRIAKSKNNKFRSYTQLKKHQKMVKRYVAIILLTLVSVFAGLLVAPIIFPQPIESEVYIPNGKGDILIGNISKNQVTVIFKTLDSANGNTPLATKAFVEFYSDKDYKNLVRRSEVDDYAVTHIIPVDSLQENNIYYVRIIATDSSLQHHSKTISSWGDGNDLLKVYTTGELIPTCATQNENRTVVQDNNENKPVIAPNSDNGMEVMQASNSSLKITEVQNENYLQPKNKVQTIISWNTNTPATTVLAYGEGNTGQKTEVIINNEKQTKHAAVLTTLKAGTTYYFSAKSVDANGNVAVSDEYSLRTPKPQSTIAEKIVENFKVIFHQIKPN